MLKIWFLKSFLLLSINSNIIWQTSESLYHSISPILREDLNFRSWFKEIRNKSYPLQSLVLNKLWQRHQWHSRNKLSALNMWVTCWIAIYLTCIKCSKYSSHLSFLTRRIFHTKWLEYANTWNEIRLYKFFNIWR